MYFTSKCNAFMGCNSPDLYSFKHLGHEWELIDIERRLPDDSKIDDYYIRMMDYSLMYHVIGWPCSQADIFGTEAFIQDVKDCCSSYCGILDQIGGW